MTSTYVDPTADVSTDASVGEGSKIWNWTKVRESASIGAGVSIGQHCYVDHGVVIGDRCKIQNSVNIFRGVTIGDEVFIGADLSLIQPPRAKTIIVLEVKFDEEFKNSTLYFPK